MPLWPGRGAALSLSADQQARGGEHAVGGLQADDAEVGAWRAAKETCCCFMNLSYIDAVVQVRSYLMCRDVQESSREISLRSLWSLIGTRILINAFI